MKCTKCGRDSSDLDDHWRLGTTCKCGEPWQDMILPGSILYGPLGEIVVQELDQKSRARDDWSVIVPAGRRGWPPQWLVCLSYFLGGAGLVLFIWLISHMRGCS